MRMSQVAIRTRTTLNTSLSSSFRDASHYFAMTVTTVNSSITSFAKQKSQLTSAATISTSTKRSLLKQWSLYANKCSVTLQKTIIFNGSLLKLVWLQTRLRWWTTSGPYSHLWQLKRSISWLSTSWKNLNSVVAKLRTINSVWMSLSWDQTTITFMRGLFTLSLNYSVTLVVSMMPWTWSFYSCYHFGRPCCWWSPCWTTVQWYISQTLAMTATMDKVQAILIIALICQTKHIKSHANQQQLTPTSLSKSSVIMIRHAIWVKSTCEVSTAPQRVTRSSK